MVIKHYKRRLTVSWHWPYWWEWHVRYGPGGLHLALGPLGVTVWRREQ